MSKAKYVMEQNKNIRFQNNKQIQTKSNANI